MVSLKKYCNLKANSIIESVIALTIISICLYFAIMIFTAVFSPKTSARFYEEQNKINEMFFLSQLKYDSLKTQNTNENLIIEEENLEDGLKKMHVHYKDSTKYEFDKSFYIINNEE
jgi:hypothetical protein